MGSATGSMMSIMESLPSLSRKATDQSTGGVEIEEDFQIEMTVVTDLATAESDIKAEFKTTAEVISSAFEDVWTPTSKGESETKSDEKDATTIELEDNENENKGPVQSFWV